MSLATLPEAVYLDVNTAIASIQEHTKAHDYVFYVYNTRPHRVVLACNRTRKYNLKGKDPNTHSSKQQKSTGSKKYRCLIKVKLYLE
jgi:hypothetical protein